MKLAAEFDDPYRRCAEHFTSHPSSAPFNKAPRSVTAISILHTEVWVLQQNCSGPSAYRLQNQYQSSSLKSLTQESQLSYYPKLLADREREERSHHCPSQWWIRTVSRDGRSGADDTDTWASLLAYNHTSSCKQMASTGCSFLIQPTKQITQEISQVPATLKFAIHENKNLPNIYILKDTLDYHS